MSSTAPVGVPRRFALVVSKHPTHGWMQLLRTDGTHEPIWWPGPALDVRPGDVLEFDVGWRVLDEKLARFVRRELFPWH